MVHFPYKNNPTIDIYFASPLNDLIAKPFSLKPGRPISRIGPNCFYANNQAVVIRYVTKSELVKLQSLKPQRIFYLIDDDFHFLQSDRSLPKDYRQRLLAFSQTLLPKLLALTDAVVAPNELILKTYPEKETFFLQPSFTWLCPDNTHFTKNSKIKILFSGTRSHLNDLHAIEETLSLICQKNPHVELTTFIGKHGPEKLLGQPNIIHRKAQNWREYKQTLKSERFHIALAPLADTRFNRSRSVNKIFDHAAFGAAGIYTDLSPINQFVKNGQDGLLVDLETPDWKTALESLIADTHKTRKIALAGVKLAKTLGDPQLVRNFWLEKLFDQNVPGVFTNKFG